MRAKYLRVALITGRVLYLFDRNDDVDFDEWFDATFLMDAVDAPPDRIEVLRSWAKRLFSASGPVSKDVAVVALQFDQLAAVESALALVLADLSVVSQRVPSTEVDAYDLGVRVTVDGGYFEPSVDLDYPFDVSEAAVELVEYIRGRVSQDASVSFPVCRRHENYYLHPVIDNRVAVWRCNRGDHIVAPIGQLHDPG